MSTNARIAIQNTDGSYLSIYSHWDGYPEHVGAILAAHYATAARACALVALGAVSILHPRLAPDPGEAHSFDAPAKGVTVAYARDRGEAGCEAVESATLADLVEECQQCAARWLYVFGPDGWRHVEILDGQAVAPSELQALAA